MRLRVARDAESILASGIAQIRSENNIASGHTSESVEEATAAARRPLSATHVDRTAIPFVTLDPESSVDLDQAFALEQAGSDLILHYAIADVGWFVKPGGALDQQAWLRGLTTYLPDGRVGLYPPSMSEGAASLLPDGPRPAVVYSVKVDSAGDVKLDGVERCVIHSRAKLAYEKVTVADMPPLLDEFARRIAAAEDRRGAARVETPEQEIVPTGDGGYQVEFRPRLASEEANAAMSLATNLAVADTLFAAGTGLFRVMAEPDERHVRRLRMTAGALGLDWPAQLSLQDFTRTLRAGDFKHAAFQLAVRRAAGGADYVGFEPGVRPWHSVMAATYCHTTAPLRRLADRYVLLAALAVGNGEPVPEDVSEAFTRLPKVMDVAESRESRVERSVIDLVEAVTLGAHVGDHFEAVVTDEDERGARIQLCEVAVVARVNARRVQPGDRLQVRLDAVDIERREVRFSRIG